MVSIDRTPVNDYVPKLQGFLANLNDTTLVTCQLLMDITASRFYALPTEQINQLLCNYICFGLDKLPEYRLLSLLRR